MKNCPFLSTTKNPVECKEDCALVELKNGKEICAVAEKFAELEDRFDRLEYYIDGDGFYAHLREKHGWT